MILALRTDSPTAELILLDDSYHPIAEVQWRADRQLAQELLGKIQELLHAHSTDMKGLTGLIGYRGPGSFTGLRIGLTVMNTLAYGLGVPIVGAQTEEWVEQGCRRLSAGDNDQIVLPEYGAEARITLPKK